MKGRRSVLSLQEEAELFRRAMGDLHRASHIAQLKVASWRTVIASEPVTPSQVQSRSLLALELARMEQNCSSLMSHAENALRLFSTLESDGLFSSTITDLMRGSSSSSSGE